MSVFLRLLTLSKRIFFVRETIFQKTKPFQLRSFPGFGVIVPVVLQAVFILSTRLTPTESPLTKNELCLLALFGTVLTGIFLGLISFYNAKQEWHL